MPGSPFFEIRHNMFMVAFAGQSYFTELVRGWEAVCSYLRDQLCDNADCEIPAAVYDPDNWIMDEVGKPFCLPKLEVDEGVWLTIYRMALPVDSTDHVPCRLEYGESGFWKAVYSDGTTKLYDECGKLQFEIPGQHNAEVCIQFHHCYNVGQCVGEQRGEDRVRANMRECLGLPRHLTTPESKYDEVEPETGTEPGRAVSPEPPTEEPHQGQAPGEVDL